MLNIALIAVLSVLASPGGGRDIPSPQSSGLVGVKTVNVTVGALNRDAAEAMGLTSQMLQSAAVSRLRNSGIRVVEDPAGADATLSIEATLVRNSAGHVLAHSDVSLQENVISERNASTRIRATVWRGGGALLLGPPSAVLRDVRSTVDNCVGRLCMEWKSANPH